MPGEAVYRALPIGERNLTASRSSREWLDIVDAWLEQASSHLANGGPAGFSPTRPHSVTL